MTSGLGAGKPYHRPVVTPPAASSRSDHLPSELEAACRLLAFCDASPSPYHACATAAAMLGEAGFTRLAEDAAWPGDPGRWFVVRGGSLVAWSLPAEHHPHDGFRIVGAHTDSPNLRVKPQPDVVRAGVRQLGVEAYGAVLLNSWLDRDLGLSGRVAVRSDGTGASLRLLRVDRPVCCIPQLAIHLDRDVTHKGLIVDAQHHLSPIWGMAAGSAPVEGWIPNVRGRGARCRRRRRALVGPDAPRPGPRGAGRAGRRADRVGAARQPGLVLGSGRVPVRTVGPGRHRGRPPRPGRLPVRPRGDRLDLRSGGRLVAPAHRARAHRVGPRRRPRDTLHRALARSACLSADMAHATHPNYADRHDPQHQVALNGGPVVKVNANVRYATDAPGSALVALAAEQAKVPLQAFAMRSDLPCGSTIGPVTAARLGITTVDVGMPQLAMHAAREHAGSHDPASYRALLAAFLDPG